MTVKHYDQSQMSKISELRYSSTDFPSAHEYCVCVLTLVWFRVKLHVRDAKTLQDKKRYVAFWLERYARREPGMPLTVVFDMSESGISNIVSMFIKLNMHQL